MHWEADIIGGIGIDAEDVGGGEVNGIPGARKIYGLHLDAYGGRTDQCRVGPHTIIPVSILYLDIQPVVVQV